jgi:DNA (cytosine-5)-methyltransferase 1
MAKTIDILKKKLLCNPKIKMIAFNFPQGINNTTSLSDILEDSVDDKYFLSDKATQNILTKQTSKGARLHLQDEAQEGKTVGVTMLSEHYELTKTGRDFERLNQASRQLYQPVPEKTDQASQSSSSEKQPEKDTPKQPSETPSTSPSQTVKQEEGALGGGIAQTLDTGMQQYTLNEDMSIRRLTPVECERLQGFKDGWTEGVSDTQRYKTLGNAVTVNVIRHIFDRILL